MKIRKRGSVTRLLFVWLLVASLLLAGCAPSTGTGNGSVAESERACVQSVRTGDSQPFLLSLARRAGQFVLSLATTVLTDTLRGLFVEAGADAALSLVFPDGTELHPESNTSASGVEALLSGGLEFGTSRAAMEALLELSGPLLIRLDGSGGAYELSITTEALAELDIDLALECSR